MFLLGLGTKKIQSKLEKDRKPIENVIRSCSRCGSFFEVVYNLEDNSNPSEVPSISEPVESIHDMFLDYLNLEERNPDNFEDFILQFMEVSIEKDSGTLNNKTNVEESLCVDCMNCLISQFSMALNNEMNIMEKYKCISDLIISSEDDNNNNDFITTIFEQEILDFDEKSDISNKEYLEIMNIYNEFLKMTQCCQYKNIKSNVNGSKEIKKEEEEGNCENKFQFFNTIEMEEIVELRQNQNLELDLKQELNQYDTKKEGMRNHIIFLRGYLERLKKTDFLNLSFYIQVKDGISSINGLRPILIEADFENWKELNAALGTSALLLYIILERHKLPLSINPCGSYSTIKDSNSSIWPLHGNTLCNSDYNECSNFDKGVSLFVFLVDSVYNAIPGTNESLPHPIDKINGTIGGISPNLLFNERESWNRAMSMNLINLKWLLVRSCESIKNKSNNNS